MRGRRQKPERLSRSNSNEEASKSRISPASAPGLTNAHRDFAGHHFCSLSAYMRTIFRKPWVFLSSGSWDTRLQKAAASRYCLRRHVRATIMSRLGEAVLADAERDAGIPLARSRQDGSGLFGSATYPVLSSQQSAPMALLTSSVMGWRAPHRRRRRTALGTTRAAGNPGWSSSSAGNHLRSGLIAGFGIAAHRPLLLLDNQLPETPLIFRHVVRRPGIRGIER